MPHLDLGAVRGRLSPKESTAPLGEQNLPPQLLPSCHTKRRRNAKCLPPPTTPSIGEALWLSWESICPQCRRPGLDLGLTPGLGRSPGEGKGYPLQCSGLQNSMDCVVHWVAKSETQLSDFHFSPSVSLGEAQSPFQFFSLMLYSLSRELILNDCFSFLFF